MRKKTAPAPTGTVNVTPYSQPLKTTLISVYYINTFIKSLYEWNTFIFSVILNVFG